MSWLHIIGVAPGGRAALSPGAAAALDNAGMVIGHARHLALAAPPQATSQHTWPQPFRAGLDMIRARRGDATAVLASGDPMWFGVGATLARHIPAAEMTVWPAPSAMSRACARLGWPLQEVTVVSLHGRPAAALMAELQPGRRLLVLTDAASRPADLGARLVAHGFGPSRLVMLAELGGPDEHVVEADAATWAHSPPAAPAPEALVTVAIEPATDATTHAHPKVPGLPETAFHHDGKITKPVARAAALARLAPMPGAVLWDIGAGAGSVAIEWLRAGGGPAHAVEPQSARRAHLAANTEALGTPSVTVHAGRAPEVLADLPRPDAVFVGGGVSTAGVLAQAWAALASGGRFVAHAVTLEGEAALLSFRGELPDPALMRLSVSQASPVGALTGWRSAMPVTQLAAVKP